MANDRKKRVVAAKIGIGLVALFITAAGAAKIRDIDLFRQSLDSWRLIPAAMRSVVSVVIPSLEVGLGSAWLLGFDRRRLTLLLAVLLLSFSGVYALHRAAGYAPECRCLGELLRVGALERKADALLLRNGVLIAVLSIGWVFVYHRQSQPVAAVSDTKALPKQDAPRGFTLIEMLVSIAVIAMLLALLLPALAHIRAIAREAVDRSNLRQHAAVLTQYTGDWNGGHPIFLDPARPASVLRWDSRDAEYEMPYFLSSLAWPIALADSYYGGHVHEDAFWSPQEPLDRIEAGDTSFATTSYSYPCAFIARPKYWNPGTRESDPARQTGLTRASEVRFPSAKALLVLQTGGWSGADDLPATATAGLTIAMCDGSANRFDGAEGVGATVFADGAGAIPDWSFHFGDWPRLHHTPDGVLGRDVIVK